MPEAAAVADTSTTVDTTTAASAEPANALEAARALSVVQTAPVAPVAIGATDATGAATGADPLAAVQDKHRVYAGEGDARTLDTAATLAKVAQAYGHLSQRLGSGDAPPETAQGYTVSVPEDLAEIVPAAELQANPGFREFLDKLHAAGFSQKQVDVAVHELLTQSIALQERAARDAAAVAREVDPFGWTA